MSEYKTLNQWFPDGKPDGKWFKELESTLVFKPFFRSDDGYWHGLTDRNLAWSRYINCKYIEYIPPKQTKKVKMYMPVYKRQDGNFITSDYFYSQKSDFRSMDLVMGWIEIEAEVEE